MGAENDGRDGAFREFVTAAWPRLPRTAYLLAGDRHPAEDLVRSTPERIYVAWCRVRGADDPLVGPGHRPRRAASGPADAASSRARRAVR